MNKSNNIYNKPRRYARKCHIPIEYARRLCKVFLKQDRQTRKHNRCPVCGKRALTYDYADSEYSDDSWIECESCGSTFDIGDPAYPKLTVGDWRESFDIVLYSSITDDEFIEFKSRESWLEFVKKQILDYEKE